LAEYDLDRFRHAQDEAGYAEIVGQLRAGRKTSHWMWFVFPQHVGLGRSETAKYFGIRTLDEARAYLEDRTLGARLVECATLVSDSGALSPEEIFGAVDALKLRSSMTLFMRASHGEDAFSRVLDRFYGGEPDPATDGLILGSER
jgi:uncharacterized protein (DUF1810 family)